jgi:hypothetical protein
MEKSPERMYAKKPNGSDVTVHSRRSPSRPQLPSGSTLFGFYGLAATIAFFGVNVQYFQLIEASIQYSNPQLLGTDPITPFLDLIASCRL